MFMPKQLVRQFMAERCTTKSEQYFQTSKLEEAVYESMVFEKQFWDYEVF